MGPPTTANSSSNNSDDTMTTTATTTTTTTTKTSSNNDAAARPLRKSSDSDLKGSVIEFMKARPFLWNKRHPGYKDHKRRDHEFQEYSAKICYSVQEIKRVWHVLRTNFFRAHKILSDKPQVGQVASPSGQNGTEKVWKYYTAMLYILEGSNLESLKKPSASSRASSSSQSLGERATPSTGRRVSSRVANNSQMNNGVGDGNGRASLMSNGTSANTSNANTPTSKLSTFNESHLLDEDDDFLYARSLSLTLRKFDPTTKEVVKLKFQQIIVDYMQQLQKQKQQQQNNYQQPQHQLSQLEPPPPSEIANMEASLATKKERAPANDVT